MTGELSSINSHQSDITIALRKGKNPYNSEVLLLLKNHECFSLDSIWNLFSFQRCRKTLSVTVFTLSSVDIYFHKDSVNKPTHTLKLEFE